MLKMIKKYVLILSVAALMLNAAVASAETEQNASQDDLRHYAGAWTYGLWQTPDGDQINLNRSNLRIYHVWYANENGNNVACFIGEENEGNGRYDTYKMLIYRGDDNRVYMKLYGARSGEVLMDGLVKIEG